MLFRRGLLILMVGLGLSAPGRAQTVSLQVNLTGIIGIVPPEDGPNPVKALIVNATNAGSNQHVPYLQWDTNKTLISNWNTAGWGCAPINGTSWISCPFGSPGETFTLSFTSTTPTHEGTNFSCVVPIQDTIGNDFNPNKGNVLSTLLIARGVYGGANVNNSQFWNYGLICLKPAETVTVSADVDLSKGILLSSTAPGKTTPLQISRANSGVPVIVLTVLNIRPAESNNLPNGSGHTGGHPDPDFLLFQAIVPSGTGNLPTPDTTGNCNNPACIPTLEPSLREATADQLRDIIRILNANGSNCPPVRFKKGTVH